MGVLGAANLAGLMLILTLALLVWFLVEERVVWCVEGGDVIFDIKDGMSLGTLAGVDVVVGSSGCLLVAEIAGVVLTGCFAS